MPISIDRAVTESWDPGGAAGRPGCVEERESVVIRLAGDSGDGMQLAGDEFSRSVAAAGHGFATRPDYPSEIRAPAGTLFGVSGYQVKYSSHEVLTPGDAADVLVAMNPAALRLSLPERDAGRGRHRELERLHRGESRQGGLPGEPARRREPVAVPGLPDRHRRAHGPRPGRARAFRGRRSADRRTTSRSGVTLWLRSPAARGRDGRNRAPLRRATGARRGQRRRAPGRLRLRRHHRDLPGHLPGAAGRRSCPAATAASPATRRSRSASWRPRSCRASGSSWARTRSRPPRTSSRRSPGSGTSTWSPSRPRTRSPGCARRSVRRSAARWGSPPPRARACRSRPRRSASRS